MTTVNCGQCDWSTTRKGDPSEILRAHYEEAHPERLDDAVNHPSHYGGDTTYEAIKVIHAWGLDFSLGNAVKYISRAGKKDPAKMIEDLEKAAWYIQSEIDLLRLGPPD